MVTEFCRIRILQNQCVEVGYIYIWMVIYSTNAILDSCFVSLLIFTGVDCFFFSKLRVNE